ncbi:MAG: indole-3-glycerol-phosphate synthase [Syntrophomonas sp.]|nr:indole-3-glycerol-phosphate synthase [Syntrophomonas sp.]
MNIKPCSQRFSSRLREYYQSGRIPVIPDIKSRSPGEGDLLQGRDPVEIAVSLVAAGAPALSVVTEAKFFGGSTELMQRIAQAVCVPVLRKDFIDNPLQLQKTLELGARAVLLIASMLEKEQLLKLIKDAIQMGLEPLVEVHNEAEVRLVNTLSLPVVGINNRNILELETDDGCVDITEKLAGFFPPQTLIISESSIASARDIQRVKASGAHAVLVGTAILKTEDPVARYNSLCLGG